MDWPTDEDKQMLGSMPKEKLLKLFFLHNKNLWRVDGLYFLGIEERFGTQPATEIDANCWSVIGKIEARELKEALKIEHFGITDLIRTLKNTSWALYQAEKESETSANRGVFRVTRCRTQETRVKKGLGEFPCKAVRLGYLRSFVGEFNPEIKMVCKTCPPDDHPRNVWCEWEFSL